MGAHCAHLFHPGAESPPEAEDRLVEFRVVFGIGNRFEVAVAERIRVDGPHGGAAGREQMMLMAIVDPTQRRVPSEQR